MHLLIVTEKYPPIVGGGETHIEQLAVGFAARGHRVTVATDTGPATAPPRPAPGLDFVEVPGLGEACTSLRCERAIAALHRALAEVPADVVHVYNTIPALLLSWLRPTITQPLCVSLFETLVPGVRVFDLFRDFELESTMQTSLGDGLRPTSVVCGSQAYRRWALRSGFDDDIIRVIPFATDVERFAFDPVARSQVRRVHGWPYDERVFLVPARPVRRKRVEDVLEALAVLRERTGVQVRLTLMEPSGRSDMPYVDELRQLATKLRVDGIVQWIAGCEWAAMPPLYSACDAVVLPSGYEGFGIALIEAMASGKPVITTDVEGHDEVVTPGTGWLYASGDASGLADAMQDVIESDTSDIVRAALDRVRSEYAHEQLVARHEQLYAELLADRGAA